MIPVSEPWIGERELEYVTDAIERGWISPQGSYVEDFETAFAEYIGTEYAYATSTGTAALHLSLVAANIGEGDEVIVPDLTWIACANVVRYVGATPVFADITPDTYTLDPESVRAALTADTAAVMPVHVYGQPCNMQPILEVADEHDLFVLEDAAEAHGATYRGAKVGSIGDAGCFSFYGNKILTMGQGGIITTDDPELAARIKLYRRDGMSTERKYYHTKIGYNYRLTNIQAAVGLAQLERVGEILREKRRVGERYRTALEDTPLRLQQNPSWGESVNWMVAPVFESNEARSVAVEALERADIETRPFFYPLHAQPPYRGTGESCPISETLSERGLNLPSAPTLTHEEIETVSDAIHDAL